MHSPIVILFCLAILMSSCQVKTKIESTPFYEKFECTTGLMKAAWYEFGADESIPPIKKLSKDFVLLVDTSFKATNFISFEEDFLRTQSNKPDKLFLRLQQDNSEMMTMGEKLERNEEKRTSYKHQADSTHIKNNNGQIQVWIINNSTDTVSIQMQDWSYICILQGLTKSGQWLPIQYWRFSTCGNSYYDKEFPPKMANSFITTIPNEGDYKTKLRFKLLGNDKFYYSNEFTGKINYCDFVEDNSNYMNGTRSSQSHYRLDTLIHLSMF